MKLRDDFGATKIIQFHKNDENNYRFQDTNGKYFTFKKFLTSNPNWMHMKGQLDPEIKKKFIAHAKIEFKEHMTKMNNKMESK